MRIDDLDTPLLDHLVAEAIGERRRDDRFRPSIDWSVAHAIIEREGIVIYREPLGSPWVASVGAATATGHTPLVAAMRALVSHRMADRIAALPSPQRARRAPAPAREHARH